VEVSESKEKDEDEAEEGIRMPKQYLRQALSRFGGMSKHFNDRWPFKALSLLPHELLEVN
jgi:hypothetical protein